MVDYEWIKKAIDAIKSGMVVKIESPDGKIKAYSCGTIIRVDIKSI